MFVFQSVDIVLVLLCNICAFHSLYISLCCTNTGYKKHSTSTQHISFYIGHKSHIDSIVIVIIEWLLFRNFVGILSSFFVFVVGIILHCWFLQQDQFRVFFVSLTSARASSL